MSDNSAIVPHGQPSGTADTDATAPAASTFGMFFHPTLAALMEVQPTSTIKAALTYKPIPATPEVWNAPPEAKKALMADYKEITQVTGEEVSHVELMLGMTRRGWNLKNHYVREHRLHYHSMPRLRSGDTEIEAIPPPFMHSLEGRCTVVSGPSGQGKTRFWSRFVQSLPLPFLLEGVPPAPRKMVVIPIFFVEASFCDSFEGLMNNIHTVLVRSLAFVGATDHDFQELFDRDRMRATNAAVAFLTMYNVGLFVLDGLSANAVNVDAHHILGFVNTLKSSTGIPVVLSGTDAWMYAAGVSGSRGSNAFNGHPLSLLPATDPMQDPTKYTESVWYQQNAYLWKNGTLSPEHVMPHKLPVWTYELTHGYRDWLALGFYELHIELINKPNLFVAGKVQLSKEHVEKLFKRALRLHGQARDYVGDFPLTAIEPAERFDFMRHLDRLSLEQLTRGDKRWITNTSMRPAWVAK